jgi:hypothetical protein
MVTMRFWVIYVWFFSCVLVLSLIGRVVLFFKRPEAVSRLDLVQGIVGILAIPALLGFAYQKPVGLHGFWMLLSFGIICFSIHEFFTDKMKKIYKLAWFKSLATIALQVALGGPALWALVRYSFFEPLLWS